MKRFEVLVIFLSLSPVVAVAEGASAASDAITVTLDPSLVTFIKWTIVVGGLFLGAFAALGVIFFGYDVQKARSALDDAQKEIRIQLDGLRTRVGDMEKEATTQIAALKAKIEAAREMREELEQLGAQLEEDLDEAAHQPKGPRRDDAGNADTDGHTGKDERTKNDRGLTEDLGNGRTTAQTQTTRSIEDLIREIIRSGKFEWTTVGRLVKGTGLSRDELIEVVRAMPDVQIGIGAKTKEQIFKLKKRS